ncbi:YoaK family protein [Antrihabitans sp. YC2-6]|uniref:YoaK family protein n=1 Tax=Antrihabitans sp. YC2-6 TaxID=2799498 RepID=UPI0018F33369|nr:YoaK family protein [Antrihabitans sp. YC2-6]MBJ8345141.1 DUF1275 domain-containing protein [Antrihabitans sp. YC2-6]
MLRHHRHEVVLASALSSLAGFVDAIGFLELGGYFVSFMSGNTTQAGVNLGRGDFRNFGLAFGLIIAFVAGVVLGTQVGRRSGANRRVVLLVLVACVLGLAALFHTIPGVAFVAPPVMAIAMGAENSVFERDGEVTIGLTYITGTLVKLGQHLSRLLDGERSRGWLRYLGLWAGLATGTFLGALSYVRIGLTSLWIAAAFAAAAALYVWRDGRPSRRIKSAS